MKENIILDTKFKHSSLSNKKILSLAAIHIYIWHWPVFISNNVLLILVNTAIDHIYICLILARQIDYVYHGVTGTNAKWYAIASMDAKWYAIMIMRYAIAGLDAKWYAKARLDAKWHACKLATVECVIDLIRHNDTMLTWYTKDKIDKK